jgi:hypothetical protein
MKRFFMTAVVLGVMAFLLTPIVRADDDSKGKGFIGLWQGITDSGLLLTVDITDIDRDEQFRIRINFQGFAPLCNEPDEQGHLLATPTTPGTINADGDLVFNESLTCSATERVIAADIETTFRLINDTTMLDVRPGIPFQRISAPLRDDDDDDDD